MMFDLLNDLTDLERFLLFVENIDNINVIKEDWDGMHGITLSTTYAGTINPSICFNFYKDGSYRMMIDTSENNLRSLYQKARNKEFKYLSLLDVLKMWWSGGCLRK